jgi:hypothetical protein
LNGAPAGAGLDPGSGVFSWTPTDAHAPGSYEVTVQATDSGSPPLNNTFTYTIEVAERGTTVIVAEAVYSGANLVLFWNSTPGRSYRIDVKHASDEAWQPWGPAMMASSPAMNVAFPLVGSRFFRVVQLD